MHVKRWTFFFVWMLLFLSKSNSQVVHLWKDSSAVLIDSIYPISISKNKTLTAVDSLIDYSFEFIGDRYRRGGIGSAGFDCSGFTMMVFKNSGIKLPHTSAGQGLVGIEISKNAIKRGDLILFKGRNRRSRNIGHVGIVISEKGEPVKFIHSSVSDGVRIDRLESEYYKNRYVKSVRLPELYR